MTAAKTVSAAGHIIHFDAPWISTNHKQRLELERVGAAGSSQCFKSSGILDKVAKRVLRKTFNRTRPITELMDRLHPDLIVLNLSMPIEGGPVFEALNRRQIPYVTLTHIVDAEQWPDDRELATLKKGYTNAQTNFFVCRQGRDLLKEMLSLPDLSTSIALNPFYTSYAAPVPWPNSVEPLRLACPARLLARHKGQDLLIRILRESTWRERSMEISFFGAGPNRESLVAMAARNRPGQILFPGHIEDVEQIWSNHHALVMPSRREGLPIALVEAMMAGRPSIVTDVGGNAELIEDGVTGFVASTASLEAVSQALERAWTNRSQLSDMGVAAARRVRELYPENPEITFASQLIKLASPKTTDSL